MRRSRYRDSKTGRFVSKTTWTRSHASGGTRYKRERYTPAPPRELEPPKAPPAPPEPPTMIRDIDELKELIAEFEDDLMYVEYEGAIDSE